MPRLDLDAHSPGQERPLLGYATLMTTYVGLVGAFAALYARSGRPLPERPGGRDVALAAVASHKAARLITKDRVGAGLRAPFTTFQGDAGPGEVDEAARGHGLRRAIGELLVCPYCLGVWVATALTMGLLVAPGATRWVMSVLVAVTGADVLQIAYAKAEGTLGG